MTGILPQHSLRRRYLAKLVLTLLGMPFTIVVQALVPRTLGPDAYGNFSFLTDTLRQVVAFIDGGSSHGYYTKLSQRPGDSSLTTVYRQILSGQTAIFLCLVGGLAAVHAAPLLWPGLSLKYISLAALFVLLTWYGQIANHTTDAYGLTIATESGRLLLRVVALSAVVWLVLSHHLSLTTYFYYSYLTPTLFILWQWWLLRRHGLLGGAGGAPPDRAACRAVRGEFYDYAAPIVLVNAASLAFSFADRWLLQTLGGAQQQGFFGLSDQLSRIGALLTGLLTPLLLREFARAHAAGDRAHMTQLFRRYVPAFYTVSVLFSVFIAVEAAPITTLFGGAQYAMAAGTVALMALLPIHQAYGQLSGSVFLATGATRIYSAISFVLMAVGLIITFLLIAPTRDHGLNLGSTGLALKMFLVQVLAVNVQLWFNTRFLKLSYAWFVWHQAWVLLLFGAIAIVSSHLIALLFHPSPLIALGYSATLYLLVCAFAIVTLPATVGYSRADLRRLLTQGRS